MTDASLTIEDARRLLGLGPHDGPDRLLGAFRTAVKLSHPDRPDGDAERFRQVLDAYRLLQAHGLAPADRNDEPRAQAWESATAAQRRKFFAAWAA